MHEVYMSWLNINLNWYKDNNHNVQPAGTKRKKNSKSCLLKPNIVAPNTIV